MDYLNPCLLQHLCFIIVYGHLFLKNLIRIHYYVPSVKGPHIKGHFCLHAEVSLKERDRCIRLIQYTEVSLKREGPLYSSNTVYRGVPKREGPLYSSNTVYRGVPKREGPLYSSNTVYRGVPKREGPLYSSNTVYCGFRAMGVRNVTFEFENKISSLSGDIE